MGNSSRTVVEHLPHHHKVKRLSLAATIGTARGNSGKQCGSVVDEIMHHRFLHICLDGQQW